MKKSERVLVGHYGQLSFRELGAAVYILGRVGLECVIEAASEGKLSLYAQNPTKKADQ